MSDLMYLEIYDLLNIIHWKRHTLPEKIPLLEKILYLTQELLRTTIFTISQRDEFMWYVNTTVNLSINIKNILLLMIMVRSQIIMDEDEVLEQVPILL